MGAAVVSVHAELGPLERQLGVLELGDVDFDDAAPTVGQQLEVIDEGGVAHRAVVEDITPGRYGRHFRLRFTDPPPVLADARSTHGQPVSGPTVRCPGTPASSDGTEYATVVDGGDTVGSAHRWPVVVDLPLDVQSMDETGQPWNFLDEARDPSLIVPGAVIVAGDEDEPVLGRVIDVVGDDQVVHVEVLGRLFAADLNFVDDADLVLAQAPLEGVPQPGAVILVGTRIAWSWATVASLDGGWMHLALTGSRRAPS
ncbi:hypothetical protein SAMN05660199_01766 [Klenkia soli]|uniref:Uncharacterized protein n=1 Tax=Klenkia soli TaxID=1052260 RepID=A0A1H0IT63_9ACTN|nr:hypothetical protein [Klenkia soli]SDO34656.1 hypothetical protein SAMN05660199_01766 [Klenkia soli]